MTKQTKAAVGGGVGGVVGAIVGEELGDREGAIIGVRLAQPLEQRLLRLRDHQIDQRD